MLKVFEQGVGMAICNKGEDDVIKNMMLQTYIAPSCRNGAIICLTTYFMPSSLHLLHTAVLYSSFPGSASVFLHL